METVTLNVKDQSVEAFMNEKMLYPLNIDRQISNSVYGHQNNNNYTGVSPYHFMHDSILFKKDCGMNVGDKFKISLQDESTQSRKKLVNNYTYQAKSYDDVALTVELVDFSIELVEYTKN